MARAAKTKEELSRLKNAGELNEAFEMFGIFPGNKTSHLVPMLTESTTKPDKAAMRDLLESLGEATDEPKAASTPLENIDRKSAEALKESLTTSDSAIRRSIALEINSEFDAAKSVATADASEKELVVLRTIKTRALQAEFLYLISLVDLTADKASQAKRVDAVNHHLHDSSFNTDVPGLMINDKDFTQLIPDELDQLIAYGVALSGSSEAKPDHSSAYTTLS